MSSNDVITHDPSGKYYVMERNPWAGGLVVAYRCTTIEEAQNAVRSLNRSQQRFLDELDADIREAANLPGEPKYFAATQAEVAEFRARGLVKPL